MKTVIPTRKETPVELETWPRWIGKHVVKVSGKPFKSKEKANTVSGIVTHPITGLRAFTFVEDDSSVECFRTVLIDGKPSWNDAPSWAFGVTFKDTEWVWAPIHGVQGAICFEERPLTHLNAADQAIQDFINDRLWARYQALLACQRAQSARDRARYLESLESQGA